MRTLRSLGRLVVDHNPFYLLSAVCMLAGCLTLTNSLSYSPLRAGQLLELILTLNVYELLLVGLGLYLIARRGVRRDGMFLLLIEIAFLVDMAFLNAEVYSVRPGLGLVVNAVVYGLAVGKLWGIFRVLRFPVGDGVLGFVLLELLVLMGLPGMFAKEALGQDGRSSMGMMYGAWWVVGALPAGYVMMVRRGYEGGLVYRVLMRVLVIAPVVSLFVHLGTANWVYKLPFCVANVGPVLVGLGVWAGHVSRRGAWGQLVLPGVGILLSMGFPDSMVWVMRGPDWSPLRVVLVAAGLIYLDGFLVYRQGMFLIAAGLCGMGFGMGSSLEDMTNHATVVAERTDGWLDWVKPRTAKEWGIASVVMSFLLLGLGFIVSLLKPVAMTHDRAD